MERIWQYSSWERRMNLERTYRFEFPWYLVMFEGLRNFVSQAKGSRKKSPEEMIGGR